MPELPLVEVGMPTVALMGFPLEHNCCPAFLLFTPSSLWLEFCAFGA